MSALRSTGLGLAALAGAIAPQAAAAPTTLLFLGDSLTAGYRLAPEHAFPARLEAALRAEGRDVKVLNAGVSGDTTAGGLRRLGWSLRAKPDWVVVALGANDGLRGVDPEVTEANLRQILTRSREAGAKVALIGMHLPKNLGDAHRNRFAAVYPVLADDLDVPLLPFLLEGVALDPALNLGDGLHPNAAGYRKVAAHVLPFVRGLLDGEASSGEADAPPAPAPSP